MAKETSKAEIRRNPLAEWIWWAAQAIQAHRRLVGILVGVVILGAAGVAAYSWYQERREHDAQGVLIKAQNFMLGEKQGAQPNPEEAKKLYVEIADSFSGTVAAEEALIRLGNLQYEGDKNEEAIATFGKYLSTYPQGRFLVMAGVGKAYAEEKKGDLQAAENTLKDVVDRAKGDPLAGEAYSSLAHVYEVMKKPEDAVRVYGQIAELFAQTHWAQNALQRMSLLKSK